MTVDNVYEKVQRKVEEFRSRRRAHAAARKFRLEKMGGRKGVFQVPVEVLRSLYFFPLSDAHPQVAAARIANGAAGDAELRRFLRQFYAENSASRYQDYIGMEIGNRKISVARPYEVPLPWAIRSVERQKEISQSNARKESQDFGASLTVDEYWTGIGPMSEDGIAVEAARIRRVTQSISAQGYQPAEGNDGDITAYLLASPDSAASYRIQIVSGTHRAAVLVALGWERLPVRVIGIVERKRCAAWHGVRRGYFTRQEAGRIFDRVWNGVSPVQVSPLPDSHLQAAV